MTIPKSIADRYHIREGDELEFMPAGDVIRVVPARRVVRDPRERVKLFERALLRQREREAGRAFPEVQERGWTREDLNDRGRTR